MKIGLLGFGVVGRGVYDLTRQREDMQVAKVVCLEDVQLWRYEKGNTNHGGN